MTNTQRIILANIAMAKKLEEEEYTTNINTFVKPEYSMLEMRDDSGLESFDELCGYSKKLEMGFKGKNYFLSNMAYAPFELKGHWFLTAEHAFHFWKCKYAKDAKRFEAGNPESIESAYAARQEGRNVIPRDNWAEVRVNVMKAVLEAKFSQNEELKDKLIRTEAGTLCEYNNWGDEFWGKALNKKGKYVGQNQLGVLLSELRDRYIEEKEAEEQLRFVSLESLYFVADEDEEET